MFTSLPGRCVKSLDMARAWVQTFVHWYNEVHHHSALKFVTPGQYHCSEDAAILAQREQLYAAARNRHPERWCRSTRDWRRPNIILLNPGYLAKTEEEATR